MPDNKSPNNQCGPMVFWRYEQDNVGGYYDPALPVRFWIQSSNSSDADYQAELMGVYFGGVDDGRDCECCGNRWSPAMDEFGDRYPHIAPYTQPKEPADTDPVYMEDGSVLKGSEVKVMVSCYQRMNDSE